MKIRTSELTRAALDWAVAKCEFPTALDADIEVWVQPLPCDDLDDFRFQPSTDWAHGGPIIEKQEIALEPMTDSDYGDGWLATRVEHPAVCMEFGPTMLVAAMRCYVTSQLGDAIEVPDEMCETTMEITQ